MHLNSAERGFTRYVLFVEGMGFVPALHFRLAAPHIRRKNRDLLYVLQATGIGFQRRGVFHHFVHGDEQEHEIELRERKRPLLINSSEVRR